MLEGAANGRVGKADGDGAEGTGVELRVSLHDVKGALRGERVIVVTDVRRSHLPLCQSQGRW